MEYIIGQIPAVKVRFALGGVIGASGWLEGPPGYRMMLVLVPESSSQGQSTQGEPDQTGPCPRCGEHKAIAVHCENCGENW